MVDICNVYCLNGCWALLLDCYGQKSNPGIDSSIVVDNVIVYRSQLLLLGKFEYTGGPIFKVVLEC